MEQVDTRPGHTRVIPRDEHIISRSNISEPALKVLYRLKNAGHDAYLVGGGVRDLLLGREPKDFDVATDALPEDVRRLFRNSRLIGRRFRLAHVRFGRDIVEVATFRAVLAPDLDAVGEEERDIHIEDGRIIRDNVYGTIEEDAWRRDFTVNALYYNIRDFSVVDYVGGYDDLHNGVLRIIGDPEKRYREDPVRLLRAVRFAAKLGFRIHPDTERPIVELGPWLQEIAAARLFEEVLKLFHGGCALQTFELLRHYNVFVHLFPQTEACLAREEHGFPLTFVTHALENTDTRIGEEKSVTPAFLFAALLWEPVRVEAEQRRAQGMPEMQAMHAAADFVLARQRERVTIPRRFTLVMREIWAMQARFTKRSGKRALRLVEHPRFRAAYDFLLLRARAGEEEQEVADWWTHFQEAKEGERKQMLQPEKRRRRRRRRPRRADGVANEEGDGSKV